MFPIAEDSDRGDASPKSGLPSSAAPVLVFLIVHSVLANVIDYVYSTS